MSEKPGTFAKGKSGNPGGRPKIFAEVQELARKHTKDNIEGIVKLAQYADDQNVQLRARVVLHEIAWGKPVQQQIISGPDNAPVQVQWLTQPV